jgi:peroxiredoxin
MKLRSVLCLAACLGTVAFAPAANQPPPVLAIGAKAPDFRLPGVDGKEHRLEDFAAAKVLVVVFTANHCPEARAAAPRLAEFEKKYRARGVATVAISGNHESALRPDELGYSPYGDSFAEMGPFAAEHGWQFPYLYDGATQAVTTAYGAQATPHVYVFDAKRELRYTGRMDDAGRAFGPVAKSYLAEAVEAVAAGREVETKTTRPVGCSTKWRWKAEAVLAEQKAWEAKPVGLESLDAAGAAALRKNATDKLRLINLWATTCGPCVAEFPALVDIQRRFQNRGFELVTISLDAPKERDKVAKFLKSRHAALPDRVAESLAKEGRVSNHYLFAGNPDALAEALDPKWGGALPFTILLAPGGEVVWRSNDEIQPFELRRAIVKWFDEHKVP